ncbi:MAG TPA: tRNA (N6-isopentenyl adenosine(37)-C2)-methylthiotransferase MiaB, partial [Alphaproteobacteria bacterium]|nr:tRNA (N6-isopentenyl adenosine(37)-C2)-methylthiotransferase MiaB [Alphaproteobacteria bacterium]
LVEQVGFAQAYSFKYSARPGTPAAAMPYQIEEAEKSDRLAVLQQLLTEQQRAFNAACVGKEFDILFEKPGRAANQIVGRSPYLQPVHIEGTAELIGDITKVRITAHGANSLSGRPADRAAPAHDVTIRAGTPA